MSGCRLGEGKSPHSVLRGFRWTTGERQATPRRGPRYATPHCKTSRLGFNRMRPPSISIPKPSREQRGGGSAWSAVHGAQRCLVILLAALGLVHCGSGSRDLFGSSGTGAGG